MVWKRKALKWGGFGSAGMLVLLLLGIAAFLWLAREYTRAHPLDLTARLPQVEKYLLPKGLQLDAEKAELFFDEGPVLRVSGLALRGADGELGVFVEQAAIQLATSQLLLFSAAPKVIEASGVTLRIVRSVDGIRVAGLDLSGEEQGKTEVEGVVEWLNGLGWNRVWGRLKTVKVANLNLLLRDDVQRAEWVLERGNMTVGRYEDDGERGTLTAVVRRLYGDVKQMKELDNVPVLVSFAHRPKADGMEIRGRLDRANAQMVTDYFPPQFKDLLQAQGQVEIGTRLMTGNRLAQPWVTMRLLNVEVKPPKGYSKPLMFPKLTLTASYVPPIEGVSESDVLSILDLQATTSKGRIVMASGTIAGVQTDPMIDMRLTSPIGEVQGIFDMFPDQLPGFAKVLKWVRPNIQEGMYQSLTAHYAGRPSAFPGCGDTCGVLDIDANFTDAKVRFLDGISPVQGREGTFQWRGQRFEVNVEKARVGEQAAADVKVVMGQIFAVSPTELRVVGRLEGDAHDMIGELAAMPATKGKVPQGIYGQHESTFDVLVPIPHGGETTFANSTVLVSSSLTNVSIRNLPELRGLDFKAPAVVASLDVSKTLRVVGKGELGSYPMEIDWSQNIAPGQPAMMTLAATGTVGSDWLLKQASITLVSMTGPVGLALNLVEDKNGRWGFAANADVAKADVNVPAANFIKPKNERLNVAVTGLYAVSESVVLDSLDIQGNKVALNGAVTWKEGNLNGSSAKLSKLIVGETDVLVNWGEGKASVTGKRIDLRGYDLFGSDEKRKGEKEDTQPDNLLLNLDVQEVLTEGGKLNGVVAVAKATKGRWDLQKLTALVNDAHKVNILTTQLRGQAGRKKMTIDIQDLGSTLNAFDIYDKLEHGKLSGEITYDTPEVGGGILTLIDFELKNPPILVQLMSLLSLEQLLSGTSSTKFKTGSIPVRIDRGVWYLDNAAFEGPSMSLRLNGSYDRTTKQLNIDGKMAPAIPLNRLVGKIPLLGGLLTGSQDGVVVADFKLKGTTDDPQINVRPLSVITPGLLKDFWRGITGSNDKPQPIVSREIKA